MAISRFQSTQHSAEDFVESAGAILFELSSKRVCLLHLIPRNEYLLAKGRRNCGESRQAAALREVTQETGYSCRALPVTMTTRAPPAVEVETSLLDEARTYENITEPFSLQIRHLAGERNVKLIWWFMAAVDEAAKVLKDRPGEEKFKVAMFDYEDAMKKLTFQDDRALLKKAIGLVEGTQR